MLLRAYVPIVHQHKFPADFDRMYGTDAFHDFLLLSAKMVYRKKEMQIKEKHANDVLDLFNHKRQTKLAGKRIAGDLAYTLEGIKRKIAKQVNPIFTIPTRCVFFLFVSVVFLKCR